MREGRAVKLRILTARIETESDIVAVRQRARRIAELLGFDRHYQTRIAAAVSEVGRYAFSEAAPSTAEFAVERDDRRQAFILRMTCPLKSPSDVEATISGESQAEGQVASGLQGAKRLMDHFEIASAPDRGSVIEFGQIIPREAGAITKTRITDIAQLLSREVADDPLALLREQNRELMQSLEETSRRKEESEHLSRELSDTNRGVVALYAELDERAEQLRRASELKSRFLSNVSHEFRTPLNSILALCQLLKERTDGELTSEQEKQVGYIRQSAHNLLELVNDLLDLAKVEAGKVELKRSPFFVHDLFGALRGALKPLSSNPAVDLIFETGGEIPELYADEAKIAQILRNLISNALKFTEDGEVRVRASYDAAASILTVSVRDTGIGIAPEHLERIFEEFGQVDSPLQLSVRGTGLGLPLSRNLAALLGGEIQVESVLGQGSVFSLRVPAVRASRVAGSRKAERDKKLVLLVDDDETFQYVFRHMLGDHAQFSLQEALSGEEALRRATENEPDAIILDLQMPQIDGFTVLQELRANPSTCRIPVLITTSLLVTAELRAKLPAGIPILSKAGLSREMITRALDELMASGAVV
jgi:signal transduction histidine kinase